ncbi:MAG: hypothetical protein ACFFCI_17515 [Promethearchaeota archaeon]
MLVPTTTKKIEVICPNCKTRDLIGIPERHIKKSSHLTTVSIQKGLICPHHFQVFIDKNMKIRGYQKVDFELNEDTIIKLRNGVKAFSLNQEDKLHHFENLILDRNDIKYQSLNSNYDEENNEKKQEITARTGKLTIQEIYEEFWEFIDEDNEKFHELIINDKRRKKLSTCSKLNEINYQQELDQKI